MPGEGRCGLRRVHRALQVAIQHSSDGYSDLAAIRPALASKAIGQLALDGGDWRAAPPLIPSLVPLKPWFGGSAREMKKRIRMRSPRKPASLWSKRASEIVMPRVYSLTKF